jgi:DNA-binding NarL/FixJ family response regulator
MAIRVLLADDHEATRADLRALLTDDDRFEVVAEAADASGAVSAAIDSRPGLAVLDVRMPGSGVAAAFEISSRLPETKVVMLTISDDDADLFPALRAGASGYLLKDTDRERLADALSDVVEGRAAMPRELMARVLEDYRDRGPRRRTVHLDRHGAELTTREWQVLDLMRRGRNTAQIARELSLSRVTVRSHVSSVVRKLGVEDRQAAVRLLTGESAP